MSRFIHGDNIKGKIRSEKDAAQKELLAEIKSKYDEWKRDNLAITDVKKADITKKAALLNAYKDFIGQPKFRKEEGRNVGFSAQSKLHSTVMEEFLYYLFKDISCLVGKTLEFGSVKAYSNMYFAPPNIDGFEKEPNLIINVKDQDFSISKKIDIESKVSAGNQWIPKVIYVPIVSIECKTYLDKTMFESGAATAEKIKKGNPYCMYLIVTETYEISADMDPRYSDINQIYVMRKQKRRNRGIKPINADLVYDLFQDVETHLNSDWHNVDSKIEQGKMI